MTRDFKGILEDLGLSQYHDAFVNQGFDAWDIILDIQESDLDALGVKLGHRRKLQRRIANARGIAPSISLSLLTKPSLDESKQDGLRQEALRTDVKQDSRGVAKRKYRRHPKPDENAPERPPSAYVLFSNKMRDDLKSQNLSFTEIAKLVGENWQTIPPADKEVFERQANAAKARYHRQLAEYKTTSDFRKYTQYLYEFKQRQAKMFKDQDLSRRPKMETTRLRHGSTSSSATPTTNSSGSGSSSERLRGSEPLSHRRERVSSATSAARSHYTSTTPTLKPASHSYDDTGLSPRATQFEHANPTEPPHRRSRHPRQPSNTRGKARTEYIHQHLPSLSDMLNNGQTNMAHPVAAEAPDGIVCASDYTASLPGRPSLDYHSSVSSSRVPSLRHESSSISTQASTSSGGSYSARSYDGSLSVRSLISEASSNGPSASSGRLNPIMTGSSGGGASNGQKPQPFDFTQGSGYGFQSDSSPFSHMKVEQSSEGDVVMTNATLPRSGANEKSRNSLDGMDALLRAGEIVGRGGRR
ncbi:hypothetical protein E4U60_006563 [Claviceps pazoutovae]|uniref:HMG box domain-containing protein n=1 Tax=Claviceps pazoutovae TaxID=1649127 RepID=A0A9P7SEJ5_9HYPO|nr:hypothetical protein E4U60_006563 [Claviceps pazoutovae]